MNRINDLFVEKRLAAARFLTIFQNFHASLEEVRNLVPLEAFVRQETVLLSELTGGCKVFEENLIIITPFGGGLTKNAKWFCIQKESEICYKTYCVETGDLALIITSENKCAILLNRPYEKAVSEN